MRRSTGLVAKRTLDVALSLVLLAVSSPLMAVIAVAIKIEGGGPVFFRQQRVGRGGRTFTICKFRSMVVGVDTPVLSLDDRRITRVGRWLRVNSLDELPQFLNVLRGEMSLVGPRPLLPGMTRPDELRRLDMRPGVTGLVEVSDPHLLNWDQRMALDIWYVENWSLGLDLRILLRTIPIIFGRKDALDPPRTDS